MKNRILTWSLFAFTLAIFVLLYNPYLVQAQVPFGGRVIMYMGPSVQPSPPFAPCPPHSVVFTTMRTIIGVTTTGRLYNWGNPFSGFLLGRYTSAPIPTCPGAIGTGFLPPNATPVFMTVGWPVYPLMFMGTSGFGF